MRRTYAAAKEADEYVEVANTIGHEVLGRSLDELPPQTRRLSASIVVHVQAIATRDDEHAQPAPALLDRLRRAVHSSPAR